MELNFNSVEMSSKPKAEASSLDYAEAPLTFNSVETIPVLNASAAFKTDSGKVFKEDVDIVPTSTSASPSPASTWNAAASPSPCAASTNQSKF